MLKFRKKIGPILMIQLNYVIKFMWESIHFFKQIQLTDNCQIQEYIDILFFIKTIVFVNELDVLNG